MLPLECCYTNSLQHGMRKERKHFLPKYFPVLEKKYAVCVAHIVYHTKRKMSIKIYKLGRNHRNIILRSKIRRGVKLPSRANFLPSPSVSQVGNPPCDIDLKVHHNSLPCVKGGGTACRDGRIVRNYIYAKNNPSVAPRQLPLHKGAFQEYLLSFYKKRSTNILIDRLWHPQRESNP